MRLRVMIAVVAGVLIAAARADDKDKLQGSWKAVTVSRGGETKGDDKDHRLVFDGDNFAIKQGNREVIKGTYKLDGAKDPKTLDLAIAEGEQKGQTSQGIYAIDGDSLKWASAPPGVDDRPKEFTTKEGAPHMVVEFKREK
jgi:uncharacterized protein (TIGR03067 family)